MRFDKSFITKTLPDMSIACGQFPENPTFSIDSRDIKPGDIFVALKGSTYDGHEFVAQALKKGAAGAIIAESKKDIVSSIKNSEDVVIVLVKDPLEALVQLAAQWRQQFNYP